MIELLVDHSGVKVMRAAVQWQWLLHADPADAAALAAATGLALPTAMLTAGCAGEWTALHLSPDEWLLTAERSIDAEALAARFDGCPVAHSLVDVSDRHLAVEVGGSRAADALAGGCPLDLERLADGVCTRTLFGKTTVLLRRTGERWRLDYPRSYDGYVVGLLRVVARDAAEAAGGI